MDESSSKDTTQSGEVPDPESVDMTDQSNTDEDHRVK